MEQNNITNNRNLILIVVLCAGLILLFVLFKTDSGFTTHIPVVGNAIENSFLGSGGGSSSPNNISNSNQNSQTGAPAGSTHSTSNGSFTVGSNTKGDNGVHPKGGAVLQPTGAYIDGTYSGISETTSGLLIVEAKITDGKLQSIDFLTLPKDASSSILNQMATTAIKNQTVEVSLINGYDDIGNAFNEALVNAVQKAIKA